MDKMSSKPMSTWKQNTSSSPPGYHNNQNEEQTELVKSRMQQVAQLRPLALQNQRMITRSMQRTLVDDNNQGHVSNQTSTTPENIRYSGPDGDQISELGYDSRESTTVCQSPNTPTRQQHIGRSSPVSYSFKQCEESDDDDGFSSSSSSSSETITPESYRTPRKSSNRRSRPISKSSSPMSNNNLSHSSSQSSIRSTDSCSSSTSVSSDDSCSSVVTLDGRVPLPFRIIDYLGVPDGLDCNGRERERTISPAMFTDWSPEMEEIMGFEAARRDNRSWYDEEWEAESEIECDDYEAGKNAKCSRKVER